MNDALPADRRGAVLIIDDVQATRAGLAELLRLRGYEAFEAKDGAEGLRALRDNPRICIVVADLMMPGASGYWFREQQLREPAIAHVPVVVFTGLTEPNVAPESLGVVEVLRKPVSLDHLLDVIRRYCDEAAGR
jgi:CheY-like chemotaxis protein